MSHPTSRRRSLLVAAATAAAAASALSGVALPGSARATGAPCSCSSPPSPDSAAHAVNALGARLHQALASGSPEENLVFSPTSVQAAMAMATTGARGATHDQLVDALDLAGVDPHGDLGALLAAIVANGEGSIELANSLWAQSGLATEESFLEALQRYYGSELHGADFVSDPSGAREEINAWVADVTAGRIPELLSPAAVTEMTRFIIVNAVHLDADWVSPFEPDNTRPEPFTTAQGEVVDVDTMHQTLVAAYAQGDSYQAITLPYTSAETAGYEMVVVLPELGELGELEQRLVDADGDLGSLIGTWSTEEVRLSLPTWDIETSTSLSAQLRSLGVVDAFDPALADFTGMTTEEPIFIGDVIHQANITVDEAGTEAAAATAVIAPAGAAPGPEPEPVEMTVDRPFFFAVRDVESGAVLFQGHVSDPS